MSFMKMVFIHSNADYYIIEKIIEMKKCNEILLERLMDI